MKTKAIYMLLTLSVLLMAYKIDVIEDISFAIRSGNSRNISKYFIEQIDLKMIDKESVYSKQQAEMILKDFFEKHIVKTYTVAHKSEPKNGSQYVIGALDTSKGKFKTYFLIKTSADKSLVQQFRIENE